MIFTNVNSESIVRVGDKTRIDVSGCFVSPDEAAISLIRVKPTALESFYDVTDSKYLDWQYTTEADHTITVEVTTDGLPTDGLYNISSLSAVNDIHFSSDTDLVDIEDDIMSYTRDGRNSFLDKHRLAKSLILDELDANRIVKDDGSRYVIDDLVDINDFKKWSQYLVLEIIFSSLSSQAGDFYDITSKRYSNKVKDSKGRAFYRLKPDGTTEESVDTFSGDLVRV